MKGNLFCPDKCGKCFDMTFLLKVKTMESIVMLLGFPELDITSGPRCEEYNIKKGGAPNSAHKRGIAIDVEFNSGAHLFALLFAAYIVGIRRYGISFKRRFLHADAGTAKDGYVENTIFSED